MSFSKKLGGWGASTSQLYVFTYNLCGIRQPYLFRFLFFFLISWASINNIVTSLAPLHLYLQHATISLAPLLDKNTVLLRCIPSWAQQRHVPTAPAIWRRQETTRPTQPYLTTTSDDAADAPHGSRFVASHKNIATPWTQPSLVHTSTWHKTVLLARQRNARQHNLCSSTVTIWFVTMTKAHTPQLSDNNRFIKYN